MYSQIVNLVFSIFSIVFGALGAYVLIFAIVGLFFSKKFPESKIKKKYAILVSARNEENVIGNLIDSINKNDYPMDKIKIFVIAHNCTDKTAEIARKYGAEVFEYNNNNERTKGYALKYLVNQIKDKYGINAFDAYMVLDADNILTQNYLSKMNDAFVYYNCERAITSYRATKNFKTNVLTGLYGLFFIANCVLDNRGRTLLNCSTRVQGTGFMLPSSSLNDGWNYVTLTEDWELSADQVLQGHKIMFCNEAVFYDEQPTSLKIMFRQRLRWQKGHLLVFRIKFLQLIKNLFKKKSYKVSTYDIAYEILPLGAITIFSVLLQTILLCLCPLFGENILNVLPSFLISNAIGILGFTIVCFVGAIALFILERDKIKTKNFFQKFLVWLFTPAFFAISILFDFVCVFVTNLQWKTIPHVDTSTFETFNNYSKIKVIEIQEQEEEQQII